MEKRAKNQVMVTIVSMVVLVGLAAAAPTFNAKPAGEIQSFVGTAPNATTIEELPAQF